MHESDKASVQRRCRCGCAVVDGYRCGNEGGQVEVEVLHARLGTATHGGVLVKKKKKALVAKFTD